MLLKNMADLHFVFLRDILVNTVWLSRQSSMIALKHRLSCYYSEFSSNATELASLTILVSVCVLKFAGFAAQS